jgi:hypothetical protein
MGVQIFFYLILFRTYEITPLRRAHQSILGLRFELTEKHGLAFEVLTVQTKQAILRVFDGD